MCLSGRCSSCQNRAIDAGVNHHDLTAVVEVNNRPYVIRDAAYKEWLAEEVPRANPDLQTVHRVAFNAGWKARKIAQYKGETS